ncbi:MAG: hypothetical protein CMO01_20880 [Thalassobius sp.]|nr:hypothetical protein [Thalassovita sp.]
MSKVNDKWMFVFLYPLIAVLVVHTGNDNSFQKLLTIPSYYSDLLLAFLCTYAVGFYYRQLYRKLHQKFGWNTSFKKTWRYQLTWALLVPISTIIIIEIIYLVFLLNIPVSQSSVFYLELPLVSLFCILINLLYLALYFRKHNQELHQQITQKDKISLGKEESFKNNFVVNSGIKTVNLPVEEVAYFKVINKTTFLFTRDGDQYLFDKNLETLKDIVNPNQFFQLNRQVIANRESIISFERTDTRKLKVDLQPHSNDSVYVSKVKSTQFLEWLN